MQQPHDLHLRKLFLKSWKPESSEYALQLFISDYIWQPDWGGGICATITTQGAQCCHVWASTSRQHPLSSTEECHRRDKGHASPLSCETWKVGFMPVRYVSLCSRFVTFALMWRQDCEFLLNGLALWTPNVRVYQVQLCRQVKFVLRRPGTGFFEKWISTDTFLLWGLCLVSQNWFPKRINGVLWIHDEALRETTLWHQC